MTLIILPPAAQLKFADLGQTLANRFPQSSALEKLIYFSNNEAWSKQNIWLGITQETYSQRVSDLQKAALIGLSLSGQSAAKVFLQRGMARLALQSGSELDEEMLTELLSTLNTVSTIGLEGYYSQ